MKKLMNTAFKSFICMLLIAACITPISLVTYAGEDIEERDKLIDSVSGYFYADEDDKPVFDREQAIADGVSEEALEIADYAYRLILDKYRYDTTGIQPRWPFYGNWCGPNYGSGTPIDILDTGCKAHDQCYSKKGWYHKCKCDEDLFSHINKNYSKMRGNQKSAADAMILWLGIKVTNRNSTGGNFSCKI